MSILNIMWAGGSAFASVQKVHQQILSRVEGCASINTWLLQGSAGIGDFQGNQVVEWNLSADQLKERRIWKLLAPFMRARFKKALPKDLEVVLLDGIGVARALLPALRTVPGVRAVVIFHGTTRLRGSDRKLFARFSDSELTLVAVSNTLAQSLECDSRRPVAVLRSAYDPVAFRAASLSREQARARLGVPSGASPVLGAVGRLVSGKGFACLLEAFAAASVHRPDARLVIVGEGPERPAFEAVIERLGLRGKVSLPGHLPEAAALYRAFDWVAIPSLDEGLGLILQEAVISGVPVLTSDLAVFREQLAESGWYAPPDDVGAWSNLMERAFSASAEVILDGQSRALAPEQAWTDFTETSRRLFSCR
ncbi:glycosyltransferase [Pseudomonas fluorescens]|uniref:glycosyltransferase n=1 Tax=Pseudomonas fluorescens TaxID=294 RepID=UPI0006423AE0|nr:glycosyltransferase [Pseudomonas fluorescens]